MLDLLSISDSFSQTDPKTWINNLQHLKAEETVCTLWVTNDTTEGGAALIQAYNNLLAKDKEQTAFYKIFAEH